MAFQFVLNLIIAFVWMFLSSEWTFLQFLVGFIIGMLFIYALRRFFNERFYMRRVGAFIYLLLLFLKELVHSSFVVIREILRPELNIHPGIFSLETDLRTDGEITALALLITLTPGTLLLEVSPDKRTLYIHAMDITDKNLLVQQIKGSFEKAIMEVMR
ncbi:Na+/H+ antiporter subunit E [Paenibacillus abyssi]|uniref:Na(+)/H(+) antiporter subunit E n=1 Tax=Paenibacillus abyssi TaxID=1340531 RepID=A0A917LG29_9BACL|nr:Na+/H+ antiporter subunit E [Paenibacillus abyssi]GGG20064.1 Na(+)/H(+) antiporter subunit E [Paenibacillus abyssi]